MDDAQRGRCERVQHLQHDADGVRNGHHRGGIECLAQASAIDELHGDKRLSFVKSKVIDGDYAGMNAAGSSLGLAAETPEVFRAVNAAHQLCRYELYGDRPSDVGAGPCRSIPGISGEEGEGGAGGEEQDALYDEAVKIVLTERKPSISYVQRRLKIGYNRAARLIETMEAAGLVGPLQSNGGREVLAPPPAGE